MPDYEPVPVAAATEPNPRGVGWVFVTLYTLSYLGTCLLFIAPLAVTLALKVNDLVG